MKQYFICILLLLFAVETTGCHDTIHEHPDEGCASITLTMNVKKSGEDSKPKCDTSGENIMKNTAGLPSGWGA